VERPVLHPPLQEQKCGAIPACAGPISILPWVAPFLEDEPPKRAPRDYTSGPKIGSSKFPSRERGCPPPRQYNHSHQVSLPIDKGVWIFNATFRVSTSNLSPVGSTLSADASVSFGGSVLAKHHIDNQLSDDVNLVGVVFSDGTQDLTLTVSAFNVGAETATSWGYSDGKIDLVRLTQTY